MIGRIKQAGGLVGLNTGSVIDCYSKIKLHHTPHMASGGFCGENRGKILRCVAQGSVSGKGQKAGFCARQTGVCTDSFWLRHEGQKENQWTDWTQSLSVGELGKNEHHPLDGREAWFLDRKYGEPELKLYDVRSEIGQYERVVEIGDRKELEEFARQVNSGTADRATLYRLTSDIDLRGKAWTPVGLDPNTPFQSGFDGGGHRIFNFMIHSNKHPFAGFFGYVGKRGGIWNLNLDCQVLGGGSTAASLCGANEGTISNCTANVRCAFSRCTGGLVGQNSGTITRCAALGKMGRGISVPWWATALLLLLLCFPLPIYFSLTAQAEAR